MFIATGMHAHNPRVPCTRLSPGEDEVKVVFSPLLGKGGLVPLSLILSRLWEIENLEVRWQQLNLLIEEDSEIVEEGLMEGLRKGKTVL